MPNNDSHQHVVKTTSQWEERAVEYWVVPRGCLCVELTPEGKTKLKVGEGNKYFSQLPYICDHGDLSNYYTKEETDTLLENLNRMAIVSTDVYDSKDDLPLVDNKLGDVRFVKSDDEDPDIYIWNGTKWISTKSDTDLSDYVTKSEFEPVKDKVDEIYPKAHTHANKDTLDNITQEKLDEIDELAEMYVEVKGDISDLKSKSHTHSNKSLLDSITQSSLWTQPDRDKFNSLHNYDDTQVKFRLVTLEEKAHTHSNKTVLDGITQEKLDEIDELAATYVIIKSDLVDLKEKAHTHANMDLLDGTTASFTTEQQAELYRLSRISTFLGAGPTWDGIFGYVPAPISGQQTYFLRGDGTWAKVKGGGDNYKAGEGITILSGEVVSDTFPFEIFPKAATVTQYVIYGNASGVGNSVSGHYEIPIKVSAPGYSDRTQTISIADPLYDGDYIDYQRQLFAHYRTNICSRVTVDHNYNYNMAIYSDGHIARFDPGAYGLAPAVSSPFEIIPGATYEIHPWDASGDRLHDFKGGMYVNLYDADMNRTRTIFQEYIGNTVIVTNSNEKYMRMTIQKPSSPFYAGYQTIYQLYPIETPCVLNELILYPNVINTIDVLTTNKPNEIYVEVVPPDDEETDPDDPMSEYTSIIHNDGVLDVTQEDPNALNELTFHYRGNVDKTLTIPTSEIPIASDTTLGGIKVGDNLTIDPVTGVLSATGGSSETYVDGKGIVFTTPGLIDLGFNFSDYINTVTSISHGSMVVDSEHEAFTLSATGNDCYTYPYEGTSIVYSIPIITGKTYRLSWDSSNDNDGIVFAFENRSTDHMHSVNQNIQKYLEFTAETTGTVNFRFGVQNSGDTIAYYSIHFYEVDNVDPNTTIINADIGKGLEFDTFDKIQVKLSNGLHFDENNAIAVDNITPQYVGVNTSDSYVLLHTKPSDWDDSWYNYYTSEYDELTASPPDWDPTKHYKYENDNYVLGSPGDTFVSTTWYDKHYKGLDPNTPVVFDSDVYYTDELHLIEDGETFDTAFEKVNEAIEHIERLEQNVQFLHDNKVDVRETVDPESNGLFGSSDVVYENSAGFVNKTGMTLWSYAKYLKVFVKDFSTNTYAIHDVAIESGDTCALSQHATIGQYGLDIQITPLQFTMSVSSGKWDISLTSGSCVAVNASQTPAGSSSSIKMVKIIQCC